MKNINKESLAHIAYILAEEADLLPGQTPEGQASLMRHNIAKKKEDEDEEGARVGDLARNPNTKKKMEYKKKKPVAPRSKLKKPRKDLGVSWSAPGRGPESVTESFAHIAYILAEALGLNEMSRADFNLGVAQEKQDYESGGKTTAANKAEREALKKASRTGKTSASAGYADASNKRRAAAKAAAANESMQNSDVYFHLGQIFLEGSKSSKRLKRITKAAENSRGYRNPTIISPNHPTVVAANKAASDQKSSELHQKEKWGPGVMRRNIRRPEVDNTDRRHSWTHDQIIAGNAALTPRDRKGWEAPQATATSKKAFNRAASRTAADSKPALTTSDRLARKRGKKEG